MNILRNDTSFYIEIDNNVIAYINFIYKDKQIIEVTKTFVSETYAGRGIAKILTEELIKYVYQLVHTQEIICLNTLNYLH